VEIQHPRMQTRGKTAFFADADTDQRLRQLSDCYSRFVNKRTTARFTISVFTRSEQSREEFRALFKNYIRMDFFIIFLFPFCCKWTQFRRIKRGELLNSSAGKRRLQSRLKQGIAAWLLSPYLPRPPPCPFPSLAFSLEAGAQAKENCKTR